MNINEILPVYLLPVEILYKEIMGKLSLRELSSTALVSKYFNDVATERCKSLALQLLLSAHLADFDSEGEFVGDPLEKIANLASALFQNEELVESLPEFGEEAKSNIELFSRLLNALSDRNVIYPLFKNIQDNEILNEPISCLVASKIPLPTLRSRVNLESNRTLLVSACARGEYKLVKVILSRGVDPNIFYFASASPILVAEKSNHPEIVTILKGYKADPNRAPMADNSLEKVNKHIKERLEKIRQSQLSN